MCTRIVSFLPGTRSPEHTDAVLCHEASVEFGKSEVHELIQLCFGRRMGVSQLHAFSNAILNIAAARSTGDRRQAEACHDVDTMHEIPTIIRSLGPSSTLPLYRSACARSVEVSRM